MTCPGPVLLPWSETTPRLHRGRLLWPREGWASAVLPSRPLRSCPGAHPGVMTIVSLGAARTPPPATWCLPPAAIPLTFPSLWPLHVFFAKSPAAYFFQSREGASSLLPDSATPLRNLPTSVSPVPLRAAAPIAPPHPETSLPSTPPLGVGGRAFVPPHNLASWWSSQPMSPGHHLPPG